MTPPYTTMAWAANQMVPKPTTSTKGGKLANAATHNSAQSERRQGQITWLPNRESVNPVHHCHPERGRRRYQLLGPNPPPDCEKSK